jgi:hypothetical protein
MAHVEDSIGLPLHVDVNDVHSATNDDNDGEFKELNHTRRNPATRTGNGQLPRSQRWAITVNKNIVLFNSFIAQRWKTDGEFAMLVKFICGQREISPRTGHIHEQVYLETLRPYTFVGVKDKIFKNQFPSIHLEICKASAEENIAYCSKLETRAPGCVPWHFGQVTKPPPRKDGSTTDAKETMASVIAREIKDGSSISEITEKHTSYMLQHGRSVQWVSDVLSHSNNGIFDPTFKRQVYCLCGPPGCGKSRWIEERFPKHYKITRANLPQGLLPGAKAIPWFDGYNGESVIVLEEMPFCCPDPAFVLSLLDPYKLTVQKKGATVMLGKQVTTVVFTSNFPPEEWFLSAPPITQRAIMDRFPEGSTKIFQAPPQSLRRVHCIQPHIDQIPVIPFPVDVVFPDVRPVGQNTATSVASSDAGGAIVGEGQYDNFNVGEESEPRLNVLTVRNLASTSRIRSKPGLQPLSTRANSIDSSSTSMTSIQEFLNSLNFTR